MQSEAVPLGLIVPVLAELCSASGGIAGCEWGVAARLLGAAGALVVAVAAPWVVWRGWAARRPGRGAPLRELPRALAWALQRGDERLRLILDSVSEAVVLVDRSGRVTYANVAAESILGITRAELIETGYARPRYVLESLDGMPLPEEEQPVQRVFRTGEAVYGVEHAIVRPDGRRLYLSVSAAPLREEGELVTVVASMRDISARERAERELRESEKRMRQMLETAQSAFIAADEQGRVVSWNAEAEQTFGWSREEAIGRKLPQLILPLEKRKDGFEGLLAYLDAGEGGPEGRRTEMTAVRRDGREFPVEVTLAVTKVGDSRIFASFVQDISERKHAESTRAHLAAIVESTTDGILSIGTDRIIQTWNPGAERILGYTADEVIGRPITLVVAPELHPEVEKTLEYVDSGKRVSGLESVSVHKDGRRVDVSLTVTRIYGATPAGGGYAVVARDITERKRARQELERQAALLDLADEAILVRDPDDRITYWSRGAEELYGWSREEAIGQIGAELLGTRFPDSFEAIRSELEEAGRWHGELIHRTRDGREIVVSSRWALQRSGADRRGTILEINTDITEQKRTEEELQRRNQELQDFAYIASHDLEEPLRKIHAFADLLATQYASGFPPEGRDYLQRMLVASTRMRQLIRDLLSYSRAGTGRPPEPVDLQETVREVVSDLFVRITESGGEVKVGELPTVEADPLQMRQLFQNLIGNALKFRRDEVPPVVEVWAEPAPARGSVVVRVRDNGIGFEPQYADRIFAPFERLHGRNRYEGTGIGLAICRKIVERHGGSIEARGVPGEGSEFLVHFPLRRG